MAEQLPGAFPNAFNRYERRLDEAADPVANQMARCARLVRESRDIPPSDRPVHDVGASVAGPILSSYVLWLLAKARDLELSTLYFVSRDGEVLLEIAEKLAPRVLPDVELRYLYSSRKAWAEDPSPGNEAWDLLLEYVRQEGLAGHDAAAVVDLGWRGTPAQGLTKRLRAAGVATPTFLFLGFDPLGNVPFQHQAWWYTGWRPKGAYAMRGSAQILEAWCSGRQGTLLGYERTKQGVRPVLSSDENRPVLDWGLPVLREAINSFANELVQHLDPEPVHSDSLTQVCIHLLRMFWTQPTPAEATRWSSFPIDLGDHAIVEPLAKAMSPGTAFRTGWGGVNESTAPTWRQGTMLITSPWGRRILKAARRLRQLSSSS